MTSHNEVLDLFDCRKWGHSVGDGAKPWAARVTRVFSGEFVAEQNQYLRNHYGCEFDK